MTSSRLQIVLDIIQTRTGTQLKDARLQRVESFLERKIAAGISANHIIDEMRNAPLDANCWQDVISEITVGETYFFRNSGHIRLLREYALPKLIRERIKRGQKYLRIWSAGSATGEEPYSIAMLLHEMLPDIDNWSIFILATDINHGFIQFAKQANYRDRAFRTETPDYIKGRWFTKANDRYQLHREIKNRVTFTGLNLVDDEYPSITNNTSNLDLILCRNVTIYFDRPTTETVINRFYRSLSDDGWLLVGHSEPQPRVYDAYQMHTHQGSIIYRKDPQEIPVQTDKLPSLHTDTVVTPHPAPTQSVTSAPAISAAPTAPPPMTPIELAQQAADREDWDETISQLEIAERENRFNPLVHYLRGLVYTHNDMNLDAIAAFKQAVYCATDFALAHYALGELHLNMGNRPQAKLCWQRAEKSLRHRHPKEIVAGADDLTVEMLRDLLAYRLQ